MRALLTPEVAPRTGIVLFKPGSELMSLFRGRVLISTPTGDMADLPSGKINDGNQPLLDEPLLNSFFRHERVIAAAGGFPDLTVWVGKINACQCDDGDGFHFHEITTLETEDGVLSLCHHHDNKLRNNGVSGEMEEVAAANVAAWIIHSACLDMGLHANHTLTLPELCWWASIKDIIDLIPEAPARRVLKMKAEQVATGTLKESLIAPVRPGREVLQEAGEVVKKVISLVADPESPESFMLRPKRKRWESEKYTRWVKAQKCACCGKQADDPHHIIGHGQGGMGTKAHDLFVIPLCRAHHDELHRDIRAFESKYGSQIELLFRFLDHAIAVGVIGADKK
ncbi:MAG: DUF968 domain-containing protein [Pantoea sp.]|uniref:DUF968 domain-containing protein n=1 Tax=Pantoea sp. TaxID=69393 RepID=UPI00290016D7|nr:DUF968 domain-containing protein [Pantoea sp.]MDU1575403.1 DUF968 domain-containing protein [Pantoea sp.]